MRHDELSNASEHAAANKQGYEDVGQNAVASHAIIDKGLDTIREEYTIILYGSYKTDDPQGIKLLEKVKGMLIDKGYKRVYLVKELSDDYLDLDKNLLRNLSENEKNFLRSIYSFQRADIPVFIFSKSSATYLSGVLMELAAYAILKFSQKVSIPGLHLPLKGPRASPQHVLVLLDETVRSSSLFFGAIELADLSLRPYKGYRKLEEEILSHMDDVARRIAPTLQWK